MLSESILRKSIGDRPLLEREQQHSVALTAVGGFPKAAFVGRVDLSNW
jgi:hypothetical protein